MEEKNNMPLPPTPPPERTDGATCKSFGMSENIDQIATALATAQGAFQTVTKDANNPFFKSKYATLAACVEMVRKPLASNGLSYIQFVGKRGGDDMMLTMLMHKSGEWILSGIPFKGAMTKAQDVGSTLSYGRRYGLCAALGIVVADEDDDGNAASGRMPPPPTTK